MQDEVGLRKPWIRFVVRKNRGWIFRIEFWKLWMNSFNN